MARFGQHRSFGAEAEFAQEQTLNAATYTLSKLDSLVKERLAGDRSRLQELFVGQEVFELLRATGQPGDLYHFEPQTFDGFYLVETSEGFEVYWQERGMKSTVRSFTSLRDAAVALFQIEQ